jgi:hypothetical protein
VALSLTSSIFAKLSKKGTNMFTNVISIPLVIGFGLIGVNFPGSLDRLWMRNDLRRRTMKGLSKGKFDTNLKREVLITNHKCQDIRRVESSHDTGKMF